MRSRTEAHLPGRCQRCYQKERLCLCAELPRVETAARFVVLRHTLEGFKSTNTARYAELALPHSQILAYDAVTHALDGPLALGRACLLFPGGDASPPPGVDTVVVLDGTWRQVRKMCRRLPQLAALPRWTVRAPQALGPRLRHSPDATQLSTLEAIAQAVEALEGEAKAEKLRRLHTLVVERTLIGRGAIPYPEPFKRAPRGRSMQPHDVAAVGEVDVVGGGGARQPGQGNDVSCERLEKARPRPDA